MKTTTSTVLTLLKNYEQNPNLQVLSKRRFFLKKASLAPSKTYTVRPLLNINLNLSSSTCLACVHCVGSQHQKRDKQFTGLSTVPLWVLPKVGTCSAVNLTSFSTPCSSSHFAHTNWFYVSNLFPNICKHLLQFRKLSFIFTLLGDNFRHL